MPDLDELLTRGVDKIYPNKEALEKVLKNVKKLRIYQGFDPTGTQLHIGHLLGLRKLKQWQDLGHEVIFLIGDFTGMIGDPTGKDKTRIPLTKEQVLKNAKTYKEQASKILRFEGDNPVKIKYNSEWLSKLSFQEIISITRLLSVNQIIKRDFFKKRFENDMDIYMNEFMYPVLQAYDSIAMDVDVEIGGTDQMFNMMVGRDLMYKMKKKNKFVMTIPLLTDSNGVKIGKTEGNVIALDDLPSDLFAKIMSLGDDIIVKGFEYLTDLSMEEIKKIKEDIKSGGNPINYKKKLAFEITKQLNGNDEAHKAQEVFQSVIQNKEQTTDISTVNTFVSGAYLSDIAIGRLVSSKSEWKRLIDQSGIKINDEPLTNPNEILSDKEIILHRGRRSIKIKPK